MKTRYLKPGTLTRCRVKWFLLGIVIGATVVALAAMWIAAQVPPEMDYRPAPATVLPVERGEGMAGLPRADLGPCLAGKDCSAPNDPARRNQPTNTTPTPSTLVLVATAAAGLAITRRTTP